MSLAVLNLLEFNREGPRFTIDTGTSRYFQLRVGRRVQHRSGLEWVDEITYSTPIEPNPNGGNPFNSRTEVVLPATRLAGGTFVQLFSFRDAEGGSPTFSEVVQIPSAVDLIDRRPSTLQRPKKMSETASFAAARRIPHEGISDRYAVGSSIEDVVASVVKLAAPIVERLLGGQPVGAGSPGDSNGLGKVLAVLLRALVGDGASTTSAAKSLSLPANVPDANRFASAEYSRPFIFGIDDALIGTLAGPLLQMLPQLLNSANQRKVQMRQADDKLISDLVSEVNRRLILQQLAAAQPPGGTASPEVAKLIALLQAGQEASTATPAVTAPAVATSLSVQTASDDRLSGRAVVTFQLANALPWNDTTKRLFAKNGAVRLNVQLTVGAPVPRAPLPKAIVRVIFKRAATHLTIAEKTFKQKDLAANTPLTLEFSAADLASLPVNEPIEVVSELRWRTTSGTYKAMGSTEVVFVNQYLLKAQGSAVTSEVELTDMQRFRPFWNKIWESPVLDAASATRGGDKKYVWELGLSLKYSVLLSALHDANGLMESKLLKGREDPESVVLRTEGRMKAGIELSVRELNKLLPQWQGHDPLPAEKLEALTTETFAASNAGEVITTVKVKGNAGDRGMVWVVPVFRLVQCTLAKVAKTDDSGQVTELTEEVVGFPLAVATRIIGLKATNGTRAMSTPSGATDSTAETSDAATEPDYAFEGYEVVFSVKVGLTPPSKSPQVPVARDRGAR